MAERLKRLTAILPDPAIHSECFASAVQPPRQKYFALPVGQIIFRSWRHPGPHEGRFAVVTKRWAEDAVDVATSTDDDAATDGESVWS